MLHLFYIITSIAKRSYHEPSSLWMLSMYAAAFRMQLFISSVRCFGYSFLKFASPCTTAEVHSTYLHSKIFRAPYRHHHVSQVKLWSNLLIIDDNVPKCLSWVNYLNNNQSSQNAQKFIRKHDVFYQSLILDANNILRSNFKSKTQPLTGSNWEKIFIVRIYL